MAYSGHDSGGLWVHSTVQVWWNLKATLCFIEFVFTCSKLTISYTLQWFLAYISCFHAEDSHSWLVVSTTICSIGMFMCWCVFTYHLLAFIEAFYYSIYSSMFVKVILNYMLKVTPNRIVKKRTKTNHQWRIRS